MPRPQSDLTKYILSLPGTLAPKEVIAKAKEKGFETTEKNVHRVRAAKRKSGAPAAARKAVASTPKKASAAAAKKSGRGGNKSAFVRGLAASMPAKDVVAAAKAAGITLNEKYVYNIRASHRAKKRSGPTSATKATRAVASTAVKSSTAKGGSEHTFVSAALDLGLTRASELLGLLRDKVRSLTV